MADVRDPEIIMPEGETVEQLTEEMLPARVVEGALARAEAAIEVQKALMRVTVAQTHPEDWVLMGNEKQGFKGLLEEAGCFRITKFWGIKFDKIDPLKDVLREDLPDGNVMFMIGLSAICERTQERASHLGVATSADRFWKTQWERAKDDALKRKLLENNIRESAITHGKGKIIRELTGTKGLPMRAMEELGVNVKLCKKAEFQEGSSGGAGGGISDAQAKYLADLLAKHTENLSATVARAWIDEANPPRDRVRAKIEELKDRRGGRKAGHDVVRKWLGLQPEGSASAETHAGEQPTGAETSSAEPQPDEPKQPEQPKQPAEPSGDPSNPDTNCPGCGRTWAFVGQYGHKKDCPEGAKK